MDTRKILIVEDELLVLQDLLRIYNWRENGYQTITAVNGILGLQKFIEERPEIVITDIRMPHMDGLEMIDHIREIEPKTQFIILSAYGEFDYAKQAINLGVSDYLLKKDISAKTIQASLDNLKSHVNLEEGTSVCQYSPIVNRAVDYIRNHYQNPELRIGGVALACDISASRLSTLFREELGVTVNDFITQTRLDNAKRLLKSGKYKVYEVADLVGYRNSAYFCTVFLQHTGIKPNKYHE